MTARWSTRRSDIITARAALIEDFRASKGRQPTATELIRLSATATLQTRPDKHEPRSLGEQRQQWRVQAEQVLGRDGVTAMIGQLGTATSPENVTTDLIAQLSATVLHVVSAQRSAWTYTNVLAEAARQVRAAGVRAELVESLTNIVADAALGRDNCLPLSRDDTAGREARIDTLLPAALRRSNGESVFTRHAAQLFTTEATLAGERRIVAAAARTDGMRATVSDVQVAMLEWSANNGGRALNHGQESMVTAMATSGARVQLALAPAGTGKTTAMGVLAAAWSNAGGTVLGLAPRAVAAQELRDALGGGYADTLEKLVWDIDRADSRPPADWVTAIDERTLVVVDEAGLASTANLDKAIAFILERGGSVRLVGDDRQRSSVSAGGILRDLAATYGALTLDEVVRFTSDGEGAASLAVRAGDRAAIGFYLDNDRIHAASLDTVAGQVFTAYQRDRATGADVIMLAPTHELVRQLNALARADRLQRDGVQGREYIAGNGEAISAGDTIITTANERGLRITGTDFVKNGDRWIVDKVTRRGELEVTHVGLGRSITIDKAYLERYGVRVGYAATIDSSQGITVGKPGLVRGVAHTVVTAGMDRAAVYVGVTRATDANHLHVPAPVTGDIDALTRPDVLTPATAAETVAAAIDTDSSQRSATTQAAELSDSALTLGHDSDAYLHAVRAGVEDLLGPDELTRITAAAEQAVPGVTAAPAWDTLRAHLATLAIGGRDPIADLTGAAAHRELGTAADVAAVLDWRLDKSGRHSLDPGPLPWLPERPAALTGHHTWCQLVDALAERVTATAGAVEDRALAWTPTTAPDWALPYLDNPSLVTELAVWRAYNQTPDADTDPAGARPAALGLRSVHADLTAAAHDHTGRPGDSVDRWAAHVVDIAPHISTDPYWAVVATKLTVADTAGVDVAALLDHAAQRGPLPDEFPAAALWSRVGTHLGAGDPTLTDPAAAGQSHQLRPQWTGQLYDVLGDALSDRITADRLWPVIVARVDTAARDGLDPHQVTHDAAGLLAAHTGHLTPDQLAPVLLWRIGLLLDPEPIDDAAAASVVDPLDAETAPPADAHLLDDSLDQSNATGASGHDAGAVPFGDGDLPYDPDYDAPLPDYDADPLPAPADTAWIEESVAAVWRPYADLEPAAQVDALNADLAAAIAERDGLHARGLSGHGAHADAVWESHGRALSERAEQLRVPAMERASAQQEWVQAAALADAAHSALAGVETRIAATGNVDPAAIDPMTLDEHDFAELLWARDEVRYRTGVAAEWRAEFDAADAALTEAAAGGPIVDVADVDAVMQLARDFDNTAQNDVQRRIIDLQGALWRAENRVANADRNPADTTPTETPDQPGSGGASRVPVLVMAAAVEPTEAVAAATAPITAQTSQDVPSLAFEDENSAMSAPTEARSDSSATENPSLRDFERALAEASTAAVAELAETEVQAADAPAAERWAALAETYVPGITEARGWTDLADAIDRIDAAGLDVTVVVPAAIDEAPLSSKRPATALTYRLYNNEPASLPTLTAQEAAAVQAIRSDALAESIAASVDEDRTPNPDVGVDR